MACPYFYPVARFENSPWSIPPRLPLGDAFSGQCRAPGSSAQPAESHVREVCNVGYGRHGCEHFPADGPADAVRFHIAKDAGELIQIQYVFEKDCWPAERGALEWIPARDLTIAARNETLRRQAQAFLESYLRRRGHP